VPLIPQSMLAIRPSGIHEGPAPRKTTMIQINLQCTAVHTRLGPVSYLSILLTCSRSFYVSPNGSILDDEHLKDGFD